MRFVKSTVILGAMIGAGFASGAELAVFFARFGYCAIPMVLVSGAVLYFVLHKYLVYNASDDKVLIKTKLIDLNELFNYVVAFNCLVILSGMMAGADEAGKGIVPFPLVSLVVGVICYFVVIFGLKGISRVNVVLVPLVVISMVGISLFGIMQPPSEADFSFSWLMPFNPVLYPCFNLLLAVGAIRKLDVKKEQARGVALIVCVVTTILMLMVVLAILISGCSEGMPLVVIARKISGVVGYVCYAVMLCAILTSMFASAFTLSVMSERFTKNRYLALGIVMCVCWLLSRMGFSNIIGYLYPILGGIGLIYFGGIILIYRRRLSTSKHEHL